MSAGVRPKNPKISSEAKKANAQVGYGSNNPEPMMFHLGSYDDLQIAQKDNQEKPNALHAAEEYINHRQ